MRSGWLVVAAVVSVAALAVGPSTAFASSPPTNVDVSQRATNESEEAVAVNPTNPKNIVVISNVVFPAAGLFEGVSVDGRRYLEKDPDCE
jgi:hypothetical protein